MKTLTFILIFLVSASSFSQGVEITGKVTDATTGGPLIGANIAQKDKPTGTITDFQGNFALKVQGPFPVTLVLSSIGFEKQLLLVTGSNQPLSIAMKPKSELLDEVVVTASRREENMLQSPVSIEKVDATAIRDSPSLNFYDGLQHVKSVDMVACGLNYKQLNTRGFNDTGNARFLQLVDGVDNQTPGLSFAVGNLFGSSDLDMESVELIPGSASALYGPVAFNGVLMMRTKDPFRYRGLSAQVTLGANHFNEQSQHVDPHALYDVAVRYAVVIKKKLAFKLNASYFAGLDWYATNYTDVDPGTPAEERGVNNPARNALNIYGDDEARTLTGIGRVSRTGYEERYLMNYNIYSVKLNGSAYYRLNDNMELIYQYNFNQGRAAYTGSNRFQLNNFIFEQHRLEMKGVNYFIRAYANIENSKDSYNAKALGQLINQTWVQDLNGQVVPADQADDMWFIRYADAYNGDITGVTPGDHAAARAFADEGRYLPGSAEFNTQKNRLIATRGLQGAGILSQSKFYHVEGQYDFNHLISWIGIMAGGNFRVYDMFTDGTLFDDLNHKIIIREGGTFVQLNKKLLSDRLDLMGSLRYDKNQNFKGRFTPRASAVITIANNNYLRASFQTGFRNPTPGDQYIKLNAGPITILGGVPDNSKGMNVYENSFTSTSLDPFFGAYGAALAGGTPPDQALLAAKDQLVKSNVAYIKPERVQSVEVGYKGVVSNRLMLDLSYYYSVYHDFILNQVVMQPASPVLGNDGKINPQAAQDLLDGNSHLFQLYTNAGERVTSQGASLGITWVLPHHYEAGGSATWADFNLHHANPEDIPAFNTPKFRTNITVGNNNITPNTGFEVTWHWQSAFDWTGTFNQLRPGRIDAYSLVDAQITYRIPSMKTSVKLGANNIFNNRIYQAYGSPAIGAIYFISAVFDPSMFR